MTWSRSSAYRSPQPPVIWRIYGGPNWWWRANRDNGFITAWPRLRVRFSESCWNVCPSVLTKCRRFKETQSGQPKSEKRAAAVPATLFFVVNIFAYRSEEHTTELQS